ncbi:MAG: hypothetical protein M3163_13985 [Actinomycetota bacterium]|nr:hypothetical protein [Actinomycetota bacterium]
MHTPAPSFRVQRDSSRLLLPSLVVAFGVAALLILVFTVARAIGARDNSEFPVIQLDRHATTTTSSKAVPTAPPAPPAPAAPVPAAPAPATPVTTVPTAPGLARPSAIPPRASVAPDDDDDADDDPSDDDD